MPTNNKFVDKHGVRRKRVMVALRQDDVDAIRKMMKAAGKTQWNLGPFVADLVRQYLLLRGIKRYEDPVYEEKRRTPSRLVKRIDGRVEVR